MQPKPDAHIQALPATIPFVAPEKTERQTGRKFLARLGANENNFGCSPKAIEAMAHAATSGAGQYGDPDSYALCQSLCAHLGVETENLVVGQGIDGLLGLIVRIFSAPQDLILTSLGAYPTFNYHVAAYNRRLHTVPYREDREDLSALAHAAQEMKPSILYLSNPDNPMGTWWQAAEIENFIGRVPQSTLIVLDEAYGETAAPGTLPAIDCQRKNVLRLRTFSKAYGLAGLRCGYAIGHPSLIAPFDKVRDHFAVNVMAQAAAEAALLDQEWLAHIVKLNNEARERLYGIAGSHGLKPIKSGTNFVTMDCGRDGAFALEILSGLMERQIFVRKPMAPDLDRCIRISTGRKEELDAFETALGAVLKGMK